MRLLVQRAIAVPVDTETLDLGSHVVEALGAQEEAREYMRRNIDAIESSMPRDTAATLLDPLARLCTPAQRSALVATFRDRAVRWMAGSLRYQQTLESIDLCVEARLGTSRGGTLP